MTPSGRWGQPCARCRWRARSSRSSIARSLTRRSVSLSSDPLAAFKPCSTISRGLPAKPPPRSRPRGRRRTRSRASLPSTMPSCLKSRARRSAWAKPPRRAPRSRTRCTARSASRASTCCTATRSDCGPGATISAAKAAGRRALAPTARPKAPTRCGPCSRRAERKPMSPIQFDQIRLPRELQALREEVREFLRREAPAMGLSSRAEYNAEFSRKVGARGWIGMTWPKRYGGGERSFLERYVVTEEFRVGNAPVALHFTADRQSGPILLKYAGEAIKSSILPRITRGECCFCIGMSEPGSGSDLFAAATRATRCPDGWRVTGTKVWTTAAHRADYMIGLFRTSPRTADDRRHGLTQFLVDMRAPGIAVSPIRDMSGRREFDEVVFDDMFVPDEHVLGEIDLAWKQATSELA